jgi:nucleoid-associated protein YgaU
MRRQKKITKETGLLFPAPGKVAYKVRRRSFLVLAGWLLLSGAAALALLAIDGPPRLPAEGWNLEQVADRLNAPSGSLPLEFIRYAVASTGWVLLGWGCFTFTLEAFAAALFWFSGCVRKGSPGRVARGLRKAADRLPASPTRRAWRGLMVGLVAFGVAGALAPGHSALASGSPPPDDPALELPEEWQAPYGPSSPNAGVFSAPESGYEIAGWQPQYPLPWTEDLHTLERPGQFLEAPQSSYREYVVVKGDTLWSIAERFYGEGRRWDLIYQANMGKAMGGGRFFQQAGLIYPGWVLQLPALPALNVSGPVPAGSYPVQPGDCLWDIAGARLGDATRWPEIWELNRGRLMPGGKLFSDPNLIYPGWSLLMPGEAGETPPEDTGKQPVPEEQPGGNTGAGNSQTEPTPATPEPTPQPEVGAPPTRTPVVTTPAVTATPAITVTVEKTPVVTSPTPPRSGGRAALVMVGTGRRGCRSGRAGTIPGGSNSLPALVAG